MENVKVTGAAGANVVLAGFRDWLQDYSGDISVILLLLQCAVAAITALYIGTKVWKMWKSKKK